MKRYKYKSNGVLSLIGAVIGSIFMLWLVLYFIPEIYYERTGKSVFPPEPERIVEPAVMSTKMIEAEKESREEVIPAEPTYKVLTMEVAAFAPLDNQSGICADRSPNETSTGNKPAMGTVAVNPKIIPYGSKIYIEGYGFGIADDTGAFVRRRTDLIEVFMPTYEEALEWGRKRDVVVFVEVQE
jgi:3D (Asp-Asp-Asp) domain-containing protein